MKKLLITLLILTSSVFAVDTQIKKDYLNSGEETPFSCHWLDNKYYDNCYSDVTNSAVIVSYILRPADVNMNNLGRLPFRADTRVADPVSPRDYYNSGYDRGHLASDASFDNTRNRLEEVYLMSNIVPQLPSTNRGIWKRLEELERDFANKYNLVEVTNYVLFNDMNKTMRLNETVAIPEAFVKEFAFKVDGNSFRKCYLVFNDGAKIKKIEKVQVRCGTYEDYVEIVEKRLASDKNKNIEIDFN